MNTDHSKFLVNYVMSYDDIVAANPYVFTVDPELGFGDLELVEHPVYGEDYPVIAVDHKNKIAFNTGFYDPWLGGDHVYVIEMHEEIKRIDLGLTHEQYKALTEGLNNA